MLAHELRRRMAAVRVAGEAVAMLRQQGADPAAMLELLLAEVADLDQLAGEVLGDRRPAAPADDRAPDVTATVQAAARTVAVARGATVRVQAGAQAEVEASPAMLRQAIENLIDNAVVHGGPGGVEVDVRPDPAAGQVEVVVADRGQRAPDAPSGHGIGMFVVRRFLEEAGGHAWVAERDGGGTKVGLRLPMAPAGEPDPLDTAVNT
jgi:two-component system, OmpR family, sensor kinase